MSGLAAVLAGRVPAGTYRWRAVDDRRDDEDPRRVVERAGWAWAHLDGRGVETRRDLLDALAVTLALGSFHGRNLDALEESLRGLGRRTVLTWEGWGVLARAEPRAFTAVTTLLTHPVPARPGQAPPPATWVLLVGEGPDLPGVADLDD